MGEFRVTALSPGSPSCGAWISEHRLGSVTAHIYEAWVWGILSGWSLTAALPDDPLGKTDVPGVHEWISNYCNAHPLDKLIDAAAELILELKKAKH